MESPRALLERYGLRAKKHWGQNFLGDERILEEIARLAVEAPGERVIELGAGLGHLTAQLLAQGARVVAVERDRDMARVLRGELGQRVEVLEADAAHLDYAHLAAPETRCTVVGNVPYHLSSPILFDLLDQVDHISHAVLLLQREVAERLAAPPGSRDWGLLSVLLQQRGRVTLERRVPAGVFHPPPKVESAVIRIDFAGAAARAPRDGNPALFRKLVKAGFGQRRKTLGNALKAARLAPAEALRAALQRVEIDPGRRGETLTVEEWEKLTTALSGN
jgi:16S rRNA (adenine1518-N6/adenine1519-N6)-dimethyltransferase